MGVFNTIHQLLLAVAICASGQAYAEVTLPGYGRFSGTTIKTTISGKSLPAPVVAWLGIDYASQPVGNARFAAVGPPAPFEGVKDATQYGSSCIQNPKLWPIDQKEACLNMNVYRPDNVPANAKLPVLVWIYGGAFTQGSARSFDGAAFVASAKEPLIVVTFNYRVNALGSLPSLAFERLGLLNLGLRDQELALKFVQKYISAFGGDPRRVTIGGRSAGAHSVGIHLFNNQKKADGASPLFSQAIMQSGAVTARTFPPASFPLYQKQFARFINLVGCEASAAASDTKLLECLRAAPISAIQNAATGICDSTDYAITWPFQPTSGGPLFEQRGSIAGANNEFFHVPVLTSSTLDEAKYYAPLNLTTNEHFLSFLGTAIPGLNQADLAELDTLYPDPLKHSDSPYIKSPVSMQYNRISAALTDYMYVCPVQETAVRMSPSVPVYKLNWAVNNGFPSWQGIPHTADTAYTWAEPNEPGKHGLEYPNVGQLLHGYYVNFVVNGDPNKGKSTQGLALHAPEWPVFKDDYKNSKPGMELRMEAFGNSTAQADSRRRKQCEWWRDTSRAARLQK